MRQGAKRCISAVFAAVFTFGVVPLQPAQIAQAAGPGSWTQTQVNTAIANGVAYLDTQQNSNGSFGFGSVAETGMALSAYGVLANGNFSSLPASYQTHVKNAIAFLLANQGPSDGVAGAFSPGSYPTYSTGIALLGLTPFKSVNASVPTAIANGRAFLTNEFQGPTYTSCNSADSSPTAGFCGGWNYDPGQGRSDESNSGYAITGLEVTGGVPTSLVADNINWNHHIQVISSNPFTQPVNGGTGFNDGGGSYQPFYAEEAPNTFASNANDSGTELFSYAFDGVPATDAHVAAAIKLDNDILSAYELGKPTYTMIYHTGKTEDGACTPNAVGCDWLADNDGGFHYSVFALTKGLGSYTPANLSNASNWYAKVVDLLLSQQATNGSWPADGRDDYDAVFATGLAVSSLGLVALPPSIGLSPASQTLTTGGSATVTATLSGGSPISSVLVTFTVTAGPNAGKTGSTSTNASGTASFTYTDSGGTGTDSIEATYKDDSGVVHTSNVASVIWQTSPPPSCNLTAVIAGPPKQIQITVQDTGSGLKSVVVTQNTNVTVSIPSFTTGTTSAVVVTATKVNQALGSTVALQVTDVAGNVTNCDPALLSVGTEPGAPTRQTVHHVARGESHVTIYNDTPGLTRLALVVDGKRLELTDLADGEQREVDVSSLMHRGANTVRIIAQGQQGGSATVLLADAPGR